MWLEVKLVVKWSVYEMVCDVVRDEMDENVKSTATGGAKRTALEYEFVMIGREEMKIKVSVSKVVWFNVNENFIVGDSGLFVMVMMVVMEMCVVSWSKAVVERESSVSYAASRGGGSKFGGGILSYGGFVGVSWGGDGLVVCVIV